MSESDSKPEEAKNGGVVVWFLDAVEHLGNKLPDPAVLFVAGIALVWITSAIFAQFEFTETLPDSDEPIRIVNLLTLDKIATFLATMTETFVGFHPLGVVLVAMLGVGVAEESGFINAVLKTLLRFTPRFLLTPMVILVAVVSHSAADAGYVLVIPLAGVIFYAAGRHPLAGIAAGFAGVSGGFSANFIPSGLDPLLAGITTEGAQVLNPEYVVNPLCNWYFTSASTLLIVAAGWIITDFIVEPKVKHSAIDGDPDDMPHMPELTQADRRGMLAAIGSILGLGLIIALWAVAPNSALQAPLPEEDLYIRLTSMRPAAPLMSSIVPLIFLFFVIPGLVHGFVSGTFKSHRDAVRGMSKAMQSMGYYMVLVFFAALFIAAFRDSGLGALLAMKGANFLKSIQASAGVTIVGIIFLTAVVNLLVGSASAKWAMLSPIFVPMLMALGISPELTQAAYRVGDSTTNIITPMMPYFPLVVVFCQRYVRNTGIGTVTSMMLPYTVVFLALWTIFLFLYWQSGLELGIQGGYVYPPAAMGGTSG
jgi:aminobenzoyl-glutamate transport protein